MRTPTFSLCLAGLILSLSSCSVFGLGKSSGKISEPEDAPIEKNPYLQNGSDVTVDIGPGQKSLLEALKDEKDKGLQLTRELRDLQQAFKQLSLRLANMEQDKNAEHATRVAAEAQEKDTATKLRDREARILNLAIEKAKLEEEILLLKIADTQHNLNEQMRRASSGASFGASPAGGH